MDDTGASTDREERLRRERLARRVAILSMVLLGLGVVALYAWIQGRPSAGETDTGAPLFSTLAPGGATNPVQGDPAADFTVAIFGGGEFSLGGHLAADGRPVFLNLWASWCEPCKAEMPALDAASQRHPGVKFIGVAVQDDLDRAADFAAEIGVSYDLAFDEDGVVIDGYPTFGMPATFLISEDGVILSRRIGELSDEQIDSFILTYFGG